MPYGSSGGWVSDGDGLPPHLGGNAGTSYSLATVVPHLPHVCLDWCRAMNEPHPTVGQVILVLVTVPSSAT